MRKFLAPFLIVIVFSLPSFVHAATYVYSNGSDITWTDIVESHYGYAIEVTITAPTSVTAGSQYQITVAKRLVDSGSIDCFDYSGESPDCQSHNAAVSVVYNGTWLGSIDSTVDAKTYTVTSAANGSNTISVNNGLPSAAYKWGARIRAQYAYFSPLDFPSVSIAITPPVIVGPQSCSPPDGTSCTSAPNSCGQTNTGKTVCTDPNTNTYSCNASVPAESNCPQPQPTDPPTVNLWWTPSTIASNGYSNIQWSTTNATYCDFWLNNTYLGNTNTGWPLQNSSGGWVYGPLTRDRSYSMTCTGPGGTRSAAATVSVASSINHARCDAITVNTQYMAGENFTGYATLFNDGSKTWSTDSNYWLGSASPLDNMTWGTSRVALPGSPIVPGASANFAINATAPTTPGPYSFNWEMVQDGVEWFADACVNASTVKINAKPTAPVTSSLSCPSPGTRATVTVSDGANNPPVTFYELRVDDLSDGWVGCVGGLDSCPNVAANGSGVATYSFNTTPGHSYRVWAHPCVGDFGDTNSCNTDVAIMGMSANVSCLGAPTGSCSVSPISGTTGTNFTWTATPNGGNGTYAYSWSGTDGLTGTAQSISKTYGTAGTKTATVTITSGGMSSSPISCTSSANVSTLPDLTAGSIAPTAATAGQTTAFTAVISNIGSSGTGSNFTNLLQKANASDGTGATDAGFMVLSPLAAGGTANATVSYTFPASDAGMIRYMRICADKNWAGDSGSVTESNEGNNCGPWTAITLSSSSGPGGSTPTATLSANPLTIRTGQTSMLSWNSTNATSCTGVGFTAGGASGNATVGPFATPGTRNYQVTCSGSGGTSPAANASVTVISPNATISANPQRVSPAPDNIAVITWSSQEVTSCAVSGPGLSSSLQSGSKSVVISAQSVYTIACQSDEGGQVTSSVTVTLGPKFEEF